MKRISVVSSFLVFMIVACASPQKRFEKAVVGNDLSGVESALADGAKPTPYMIGGKSLTALEHAIKHKNREMVARLLKADAPVKNTVSDALIVGIYTGDLEIVKMLVASGKFDPKSDKGTKLVVAIHSGRPEIVEYLIGVGFPVNATPGYAPPLAVAIDKNDTESAKKLLHAGANPNLKDERGATVFCLALAQNRSEIALAMLAAKPDVKTHCGNGSPLYWAEKHKNPELSAKIKSLGGKSEYVPPKAESSKFNHSTAKSEKQRELDRIKATMDYLAPKIHAIENEMSALGAQVGNTGYSSPTVTGIDCDGQNQNCRNKYQGGGETGSSYIGRKDREERIRKLRSERFDLVRQYDRLAEEYNKTLEGR